ncbi:MAG: 50S ribosomal protein L25 [Pirellulales bacterium]|nr:50S ribosomal protein L25 [Pirellulales bacterium]
MAEQLSVELRENQGKLNNRRLRRGGHVPAVLYGHGLENVKLSVSEDALSLALRHGSRLVDLAGGVNESAFIRDLQWNTWGTQVLHVDFTRISADEEVEVTIAIELRGEAPGVRAGGVVEHLIHQVEIACPAGSIPEKLKVNINHLKLEDKILLSQLEIPQGARLLADDLEAVIVQCVVPAELPEEEAAAAVEGEPEVIGAKKEEEEAAEK